MTENIDSKNVTTAALAYLGDCVVEICVRSLLVKEGLSSSRHLNSEALNFVRAPEQAEALHKILDVLTEEENAAYRRGRNIGHTNTPKNCTVSQYRHATGFEALFGYLHLEGKNERINELFCLAYADKIEDLRNKKANL
ncbi:MAG: ribonuclease III [Clostridia bacterium]|nr:ribonuclease III [Clostridia bacterium]